MSGIYAEKKEGDFKIVEAGTYAARCYSMIEIGTVETEFNGEKKKLRRVSITWELPTEKAVFHSEKGEEPFVISKMYTLSMHEKASLRKDLESWRGKGFTEEEAKRFDITKLLGVPCMLSVIHKPGKNDPTKTYATVSSLSRLPKGMECPEQINKSRILSYESFDWDVFDSLSDYMKDQIKSSDEFKSLQSPNETIDTQPEFTPDPADDLPF